MLRGWKFVGLAATIILYVLGILVLSIVNLQTPRNEKRGKNSRIVTDVSKIINSRSSTLRMNKTLFLFSDGFSS